MEAEVVQGCIFLLFLCAMLFSLFATPTGSSLSCPVSTQLGIEKSPWKSELTTCRRIQSKRCASYEFLHPTAINFKWKQKLPVSSWLHYHTAGSEERDHEDCKPETHGNSGFQREGEGGEGEKEREEKAIQKQNITHTHTTPPHQWECE